MTKNNRLDRRVILATVVAGFVMLTTGLGYRIVAARLAAPADVALLSPEALERLPMKLGDWAGQALPLDEAVVEATDTDAHVSRRYSRQNSADSVWLYIAYGVRPRDLMPHRPEVCYTGSGWTPLGRRSMELHLADGTKLPCNILQFSRGMLNKQEVVVLDYYIVDGQYCRDVSLLRAKGWRGSGTVGHVAQVQIVASVLPSLPVDSLERSVLAFALESALSISSLFEAAKESACAGEDRPGPNDISGEGRQ